MSELNTFKSAGVRRQLLTTVSALVLIASAHFSTQAEADDDADRPTVWIEFGGQLERVTRGEYRLEPPFVLKEPKPDFETTSPLSLVRPPRYAIGGEGSLTFEPAGSDWVFAAAIRYGRSNGNKHFHNQTAVATSVMGANSSPKPNANNTVLYTPGRFEDVSTRYRESHAILDFTVGKDIGLGVLGSIVANVGVRYAQFNAASNVNLSAKPDFNKQFGSELVPIAPPKYLHLYYSGKAFHNYRANLTAERNFRGVGPQLSFNGAVPLIGSQQNNELTFDWGINGALLFGKQRTSAVTNEYGHYHLPTIHYGGVTYHRTGGHAGSRSVTIPNLGGFAGLSMRYSNAKVSFGYRADVFFGAMDGGIDARKSVTQGFYGPFATVAVGLGG